MGVTALKSDDILTDTTFMNLFHVQLGILEKRPTGIKTENLIKEKRTRITTVCLCT